MLAIDCLADYRADFILLISSNSSTNLISELLIYFLLNIAMNPNDFLASLYLLAEQRYLGDSGTKKQAITVATLRIIPKI